MYGKSHEIKKVISDAKERMKSGFWTDVIEQREIDRKNAEKTGTSIEAVDKYYKKLVRHKVEDKKLEPSEQELYNKVCEMHQREELVTNPLAELIDKQYMDTLDYNESQRYILNLSKTYIKLEERYKKEQNLIRN